MAAKRYRQPKKVKMRGITERLLIAGLILFCVVVVIFCVYMVLTSLGKSGLQSHAESVANAELAAQLSDETTSGEIEGEAPRELEEGQILVNGEVYAYNEDIMTFLCMGVDSRKGITEEKTPGEAGQADAILLAVVNPHTESIQVIAVNRDTMMDIELYDTAGGYIGKEKKQITLQYAYGDGRDKSCQLMEKAVSELFYGIPIHGYGALDMKSIATLNDSVGGVEVTVLEDMTWAVKSWTKGTKLNLKGEEALLYIRERDDQSQELGSNLDRIERQKQYLNQYVAKLKGKLKEDMTFALTLYSDVSKHMVTSLTVDEITYLAGKLTGYEFSTESIISVPGTSQMGEKNEEFYVDEDALKDIVIEVFYEKVE